MRMRERLAYQIAWNRFASILLMFTLALVLAATGALLIAPRAHADGDSATLKITSSSPYVYGSSSIAVQLTVTLGVPLSDSTLDEQSQSLHVSNGSNWSLGWVSSSADGKSLTYSGSINPSENGGLVPPGDYTATAAYLNPDTHLTTTSNPVSFTVEKTPSATSCQLVQGMVIAGESLTISTGISIPNGDTFNVTLSGPETINATLQSDMNRNLHMTAPSVPGTYTVTCAFAGDEFRAPSSAQTTISVHDNAHVAGMKLDTNPTTIKRGVTMTFYIVLTPQAGYPAPTGYLTITMGIFAYNSIPVGANGDTLVQLDPLPVYTSNPFSHITIVYGGDSRYLNSSFTFPLTNPAIPGSAPHSGTTASGGSGHSGGSATPTAKAGTPTPTATATATAVASPAPAATTRPSPDRSQTNVLLPWLAGGLGALIVLAALASGIALALRRKRAHVDAPAPAPVAVADAAQVATPPAPDPDQ